MTIRVVLADDQALLRATFRLLIDATEGMTVVGEAADGREAVDRARSGRADVVLMDIRMPGTDGLSATRMISEAADLSGVKVLILTTFEQDEYVVEALWAGASGFLGKGVSPEELLTAIRVVAAGDALLSPVATRSLIARFRAQPRALPGHHHERLADLTPREREVLVLVAAGLSNVAIADRLYLSPLTVKSHLGRIMTKLAVRDRAQLVVLAYECGLVRPGDAGRVG
ncbi:LuxR family transcriptional regulator [Micromonospora rosaria]|uniref:LuxR family transcriptional regulator n=1 Tax=Micromonospora rosaria TaxID=47874 RepID=A0A136PS73_9ACTN|nr:response regulator transcription factor [Micromonospora rosaria]KXK61174.1 LuxR family transcriptional regulator [Micromonospora rosaria]